MGVGTPLGFGGVALEVAPLPYLVLTNGVGSNGYALQLASMAHYRMTQGAYTARVGAGFSSGRYQWSEHPVMFILPSSAMDEDIFRKHWTRAVWVNLEASLERYRVARFGWRAYLGTALLTNPGAATCHTSVGYGELRLQGEEACRTHNPPTAMLYTGFAIRLSWFL